MALGESVRELGQFLEACEREDRTVTSVELGGDEDPVVASVTLTVPDATDGQWPPALEAPQITTDGSLQFTLSSASNVVPNGEHDIDVECVTADLAADGSLTVTLRVRPRERLASASSVAAEASDERGAVDGESDLPPFKDPDHLAGLYTSCDTFAEMAETIDMDVTAETVRRYMIDYDIHQPNTYRTEREGDRNKPASPTDTGTSTEPIVLSDGIGLPDDVTIDTLIDTVKRSNTFYEVTREVNVDREDARDMLEQLNLLDLVMGRLATEHERDLSREEIVDRLREAPGTE